MFQLSVRFTRYPLTTRSAGAGAVKHVQPQLLMRPIRGMLTTAPPPATTTIRTSIETFTSYGSSLHAPANITLQQQQWRFQTTTTRSFANAAAASDAAPEGRGITVARSKGKKSSYCYGCGAEIVKGTTGSMGTVPKKTGYWAEKSQTLKISKIRNWALCPRCKTLKKAAKSGDAVQDMVDVLGPDSAMTEVFRKEVGKLRAKENIVIVLCVDAINMAGTLIRTIRNYIGGNPILLAVTRCDLLPDYVSDAKSVPELKQVFAERAKEIQPADIYLCTEEKEYKKELPGIKELAKDLWKHLNERDVYVVGAANIGKSTLTDKLIGFFVKRGEREEHFFDRLSKRRVEKLREARVTKSALPGTTLQNIRVPCFEDHRQALWDTPGLLLDVSLAHFPIRDFKRIRANRPTKIEADILEVPEKSFALLICEKADDTPLVRVEVRLRKNAEGEGPVRLVWNSIFPLRTKIVDIESACKEEKERAMQFAETQSDPEGTPEIKPERTAERTPERTPEERAALKAERKRLYEERVKQEQEELGMKEWSRQQKEKKAKKAEFDRAKTLAKLSEVDQVVIDGGVGMDLEIANFGWIGILPPRTAMVKTFASSTGVRVVKTSPMALPEDWGEYKTPPTKEEKASKKSQKEDSDDEENADMLGWEDYAEYGVSEWDDESYWGSESEYGGYDEFGSFEDEDEGRYNKRGRHYPPNSHEEKEDDPWEKYSGEHVGWQFDADTRWSKGKIFEGWNPIREKEKDDS